MLSLEAHRAFVAVVFLAGGLFMASCARVPEHTVNLLTASAPADRTLSAEPGFSLTVYSTADPMHFSPQDLFQDQGSAMYGLGPGPVLYVPGYGVVREVRRVQLAAGTNRLEFSDVAAGIDPTTVSFQSLTAPKTTAALEQNFEYDLTSPDKLLEKYLGRDVVLTVKSNGSQSTPQTIRGRLLSAAGNAYVLQTVDSDTQLILQRTENVESIRLPELKTGFVSKPTLNWKIETEQGGEHDVQVTYQTDGLTWRADYNVTLSQDERSADLSAWVTLLNASGMSYPDARLKLVAGNVRRFLSERAQRVAGYGYAAGGYGGTGARETGFRENNFFEYHLYTLGRTTTLPNNSTKQIELFPAKTGIPVEKVFVYYGLAADENFAFLPAPQIDRSLGTKSNKTVDIYVRFGNRASNGLGIPLPAGRMRLYKADPADGSREFIGEDVIQHTPKDEEVMVRLGTSFDLVGERTQTSYKDTSNSATEQFQITLRNHKSEPVHIIVKENLFRWYNWKITESSDKWEKQDSRTIHFPVDVPAGGEKKVTYTVYYWW